MEEDTREKHLAKAVSVSERLSRYAEGEGIEDVDTASIIRKWRRRAQCPH